MIYRCNDARPDQLFIIGISHRDTLTRLNGDKTARVQAEVYKLAEWLIQTREVELLLPEGYFRSRPSETQSHAPEVRKPAKCPPSLDMKALEKKLGDETSFVNAEMLLLKHYGLRAQQVEEPFYYREVGAHLRKLSQGTDSCDPRLLRSELDYLQARRSASMIQRIPDLIAGDFQAGKIRTKRALFTIGLSHLPQIMKYLQEKKITISSPLGSSKAFEDYTAEVNYVYAGGQGEGSDRNVNEVSDSARYGASAWNRREAFIDARNESSDAGVTAKGYDRLNEGRPVKSFRGEITDSPSARYGTHWWFGDRVICEYRGVEYDVIVTAVSVTLDSNGNESVTGKFEVVD